MIFAIGSDRLALTNNSIVESRAAESEAFESIIGFKSSTLLPKFLCCILGS